MLVLSEIAPNSKPEKQALTALAVNAPWPALLFPDPLDARFTLPRTSFRHTSFSVSETQDPAERFHRSVTLDTRRVGQDTGRIVDEVLSYLSGLVGTTVKDKP